MKVKHGLLATVLVMVVAAWPAGSPADTPIARAAATCSDYANQAEAQRAADTVDGDGDGIYCVISPR
jgi:hypothetical protein